MTLPKFALICLLLLLGLSLVGITTPEAKTWFPPDKIPNETIEKVFTFTGGSGEGFEWLATDNYLYFTSTFASEVRVYRSSDGVSWSWIGNASRISATGYGRLVKATNGSLFYSSGSSYGKIQRSDNGGVSWTIIKTVLDTHIHSIAWFNNSLFYTTGDSNKTTAYWRADVGWKTVNLPTLEGVGQQGLHFFQYNNTLYLSSESAVPSTRIFQWNGANWITVADFDEFKGMPALWCHAIEGNRIYFGVGTKDNKTPHLIYSDDLVTFKTVYAVNSNDVILSLQVANGTLYYFTYGSTYFFKGYVGNDSQVTFRKISVPSGNNAYGWHGSVLWKGYVYFGATGSNIYRFKPAAETDKRRFEGSFSGTKLSATQWSVQLDEDYAFTLIDSDNFNDDALAAKWQMINISGRLAEYSESDGYLYMKATEEVGGFYTNVAQYTSFKMEFRANTTGTGNNMAVFMYVIDTGNFYYFNMKDLAGGGVILRRKRASGAWAGTEGAAYPSWSTTTFKNYTLFVRQGWSAKIYCDGVLLWEQDVPFSWASGYVGIGSMYGKIWVDDIKIYNATINYRASGSFQTNWIDSDLTDPSWSLTWFNASIASGQSITVKINGKEISSQTGSLVETITLSNGFEWYQLNESQGYRYIQLNFTLTTNNNSTTPFLHQGYGLQPYDIHPFIIKQITNGSLSDSYQNTILRRLMASIKSLDGQVQIQIFTSGYRPRYLRVNGQYLDASQWSWNSNTSILTFSVSGSDVEAIFGISDEEGAGLGALSTLAGALGAFRRKIAKKRKYLVFLLLAIVGIIIFVICFIIAVY